MKKMITLLALSMLLLANAKLSGARPIQRPFTIKNNSDYSLSIRVGSPVVFSWPQWTLALPRLEKDSDASLYVGDMDLVKGESKVLTVAPVGAFAIDFISYNGALSGYKAISGHDSIVEITNSDLFPR